MVMSLVPGKYRAQKVLPGPDLDGVANHLPMMQSLVKKEFKSDIPINVIF